MSVTATGTEFERPQPASTTDGPLTGDSREVSLALLIYLATIVASILYPTSFFSAANLRVVLNNLAVEGILALGMMMLMIGGVFDLSVGSLMSLVGVVSGWLMVGRGWPIGASVAAGMLLGTLGGFVNGLLVAHARVNALIATLGTLGIFQGVAILIAGPSIANLPAQFTRLGQSELLGLQAPVWLLLVLLLVTHFGLHHTRLMRQYYYIGSNARAARLSGIEVERMQILGFTMMGLMAGLAGLAFAARVGTAVSSAGAGAELRVITAVILGGASLTGGKGSMPGALLGVIFMALVNNILIITRVSSYWQSIVVGIILVLAVALDSYRTPGEGVMKPTRRDLLVTGAGMAVGAVLTNFADRGKPPSGVLSRPAELAAIVDRTGDEYVWLSANSRLPLFVAHDHPALFQAGRELDVRVTIAGPDTVDIPGLVAAVEQTAARRPTGMMVVGWDPSALIPAIDRAVESGIAVVCVDADVPGSKRQAFIGTDWRDLGVRQGQAMVRALKGRTGTVAMLGLIEQSIDQEAFAGFRSVAGRAGLNVLEPFQDKGNQAEASRVAASLLQAHTDLVGMAGFDSESGPGMGQAIREAGKGGHVVATCVEAEEQHLRLVKDGVLHACVGQKRALFTYQGVKTLDAIAHPRLSFSANDRAAGISPAPVILHTGTYTVTRETVDLFLPGATSR